MKFKLLKTKLEHEIEVHFEDDAFDYVTKNRTTFDLNFEIIEHGITYNIEGKYHYGPEIYKKSEIKCYKIQDNKPVYLDLVILPVNNNPNKSNLGKVLEEIAEKEKDKLEERQRSDKMINRNIETILGHDKK